MIFLHFLIFSIFQVAFSVSQTCGKFSFNSGLIVNGETTVQGEFPFSVALLKLRDQKFFCAATLITNKHSITAAHCIHEKSASRQTEAEDIVALLGRYNLKHSYERGSSTMEINKIIIHEDWKPYVTRYDADIAILFFEREIQFNEFIKPACLPDSSKSNSLIEGKVVGWGSSENTGFKNAEDIPRKVNIKKPPSNEYCFLHKKDLTELSSNRTFCAGGENSGPCKGDSGGGFFVNIDSTWFLQGIVSSSLINSDLACDVTNFAVYTNVAHYVKWIWQRVEGIEPLDLLCEYEVATNLKSKSYYCASNIEIKTDNYVITSTFGNHQKGKSNSDVTLLDFSDDDDKTREIYFIPSGIGDAFPSLSILYIQYCKLTRLARKGFKRMNNLNTISLTNNLIEHIDEDTFYEVPKLYSLRINGNKLKSIPYNMLVHSNRLQFFTFDGNLIEEFDGGIFRNCPLIKWINLDDNYLKKISINLGSFKNLERAIFTDNICVKASYKSSGGGTNTLQELQEIINKNC